MDFAIIQPIQASLAHRAPSMLPYTHGIIVLSNTCWNLSLTTAYQQLQTVFIHRSLFLAGILEFTIQYALSSVVV